MEFNDTFVIIGANIPGRRLKLRRNHDQHVQYIHAYSIASLTKVYNMFCYLRQVHAKKLYEQQHQGHENHETVAQLEEWIETIPPLKRVKPQGNNWDWTFSPQIIFVQAPEFFLRWTISRLYNDVMHNGLVVQYTIERLRYRILKCIRP